ncbi:serine/threonine-protein kinase [Lentisphaera profundi]|uniref:Serine/threonine-protein kinase n=1 Tax=Lentisphaera profundi TaxID=1658616 RepID=A0ABY7VW08_9BACT|nr:serine/threonine-protein kinase [Lentisphaera profundi]WDE98086.1 serine/threonine-protein kinase [Lentisphaera profundi]
MKFQCVLCKSTYQAESLELGTSKNCPTCSKKIVVPRKIYDPGRVIGQDFSIEKVVGVGGMGTVFLARQISLDRPIALKVLLRRYSADNKFRQEFLREAQSVASMIHGNLVQVFAFGVDESDLYLAMEYVEGDTLGHRLEKNGKLDVSEALGIIQQVTEGLHYAWEKDSLIHRDIKPDNIMITADGWVKLTDMGLARQQRDLQDVQEVSGTPAYMNPEQFLKDPMDCRADIYSLGVVLYHSVTGVLPFDSENVSELARQHIQDPVVFNNRRVDLPLDVRKLITKMMEKSPEKRFLDHEALIKEIVRVRKSLSKDPSMVPGIHTISFNRKDIGDLQLGGKKKETNSLDSLPRKKIRSLSANDDYHDAEAFIMSEGQNSTSNIFWTNLIAITAVTAALMVSIFSSPSKKVYEVEAENLLDRIQQGSLQIARTRLELEKALQGLPEEGNAREMSLKAKLLSVLNEVGQQEQKALQAKLDKSSEKLNHIVREKAILINEVRQEKRALRTKEDLYTHVLSDINKSKEILTQETITEEQVDEVPQLLFNDAIMLEKLWTETKTKILMSSFKEVYYWKPRLALSLISAQKSNLFGVYLSEVEDLEKLIGKAQEYQLKFAQGLSLLEGQDLLLPGGDLEDISISVYNTDEGSVELEDSFGKTYKIPQLPMIQQKYLYQTIYPIKDDDKLYAAYALCALQFSEAIENDADPDMLAVVFNHYVFNRYNVINNYLKNNLQSRARESGMKLLQVTELFPSELNNIQQKLDTILGDGWKYDSTATKDGLQ